MARPSTIRDEDLLEAAHAVLMERGVRATTAEVAQRAGVSEGTLFKRFGSKASLFRAAMSPDSKMELLESRMAALSNLEGRALVEQSVELLVGTLRHVVPIAILMMGGNAHDDEMPEELKGPNPMPVRAIRLWAGFFERAMREGKLRATDPETLARCLIGSVWHFLFMDCVMGPAVVPMPEPMFIRQLAELIWRGVAPTVVASPTPVPPPKSSTTARRKGR